MSVWKERKQSKKVIQILISLLCPAVAFYLMEAYTHNAWEEVRFFAQWFNIFLFELIAWILIGVIGNVRLALRIQLIAAMLYGIVNAYVVRFRTNPIVPWDFFSWKTAVSVASNYDFMPNCAMILVTAAFVVCIVLLQFVELRIKKEWRVKGLCFAGIFVVCLCQFVKNLQEEEFQTKYKLYPFLFTPAYMAQVNGLSVTFAMDLAYVRVEKPDGYDKEKVQELLQSYENDAEEISSFQETQKLPNLIVVMNESFSDLSHLGAFTASEDVMPYFHSLQKGQENTITGTLHVSVCGGNTANTEFEFLTGNSMAFLPQGSIPYQQYITDEIQALPSYLSSLGYETVAMHPYYASGWDRDTVYPLLGFSESIFKDGYKGASYVRKYISDDSCVNQIIEYYEKKEKNKPLFLFQVTMQNHGGYSELYSNFTPTITVDGIESTSLSQYLSLVRLSDASLEKLISYFEQQTEPTVIVFFGDHQPNDTVASPILKQNGLSVKQLTTQQLKMRYEVPYVIWANYEIESGTQKEISANYLAAQVLKSAKIPTNAYMNYLLTLKEQYPVISAVRVKKADGTDTDISQEKEELKEYQSVQYERLFD